MPTPRVDITHEPHAREHLFAAMGSPETPPMYVQGGNLAALVTTPAGPRVQAMTSDALRVWMADHVDTFKTTAKGEVRPVLVPGTLCKTLLAPGERLPELRGLVRWPVLRPDGTLLTEPGHDRTTGILYDPMTGLPDVPAAPTPADVQAARDLITGDMLGGFPWVADSDRAQYVAALLSPIMRPYQPGPTPLFAITASAPGSGKSYLAEGVSSLYGGEFMAPGMRTEELRKNITTMYKNASVGGAVVIDNVKEGDKLDSPVLAALLTSDTWSDRAIGTSTQIRVPNDRVWIATGNNVRTGGDMGRRTVWVRIDARCAKPEERAFAVDFHVWLNENKPAVLGALLTLARGWVQAGAPRRDVRLGGYSAWASMMAGLLDWAGIPGFNDDRDKTGENLDEQFEDWSVFLREWRDLYGNAPVKAQQLTGHPILADLIPRTDAGAMSHIKIGFLLRAHRNRYYGGARVERAWDAHRKCWVWMCLEGDEQAPETITEATADEPAPYIPPAAPSAGTRTAPSFAHGPVIRTARPCPNRPRPVRNAPAPRPGTRTPGRRTAARRPMTA
ncbi:hypothetical protein ACIPRL_07920 [Streptomyces sp. NPDC090085]|uniref:hypothetical protein n=1 Tax=Streptomyces sp. NPDC090085 TaxID=3365943 RepID=UPI003819891A